MKLTNFSFKKEAAWLMVLGILPLILSLLVLAVILFIRWV